MYQRLVLGCVCVHAHVCVHVCVCAHRKGERQRETHTYTVRGSMPYLGKKNWMARMKPGYVSRE